MSVDSIYIPPMTEIGDYGDKAKFMQLVMEHYKIDPGNLKTAEQFDLYMAASKAFTAINSNNFRCEQNDDQWKLDFQAITAAEMQDFYANTQCGNQPYDPAKSFEVKLADVQAYLWRDLDSECDMPVQPVILQR